LFEQPPSRWGDESPWPPEATVASLSRADFAVPTRKEVRLVVRRPDDSFDVTIFDAASGQTVTNNYWGVVYTPHVRVFDKFRHNATTAQYDAATASFPQDLWEAIEYTHYMQSTKVFAATTDPFWTKRGADGKRLMSVTLSDRLTRGTYPVDYGPSRGPRKGSGIFLSYTWNDDSLKFLGTNETPRDHALMCTTLLSSIYPNINFEDEFAPAAPFAQQTWEDQSYYLGAFKMNLPGQYEYQKRIFSQFMDGMTGGAPGRPDRFVLAGDDVSWTGGWAEGAVTTAINAVDKLVGVLGGSRITKSPIQSWNELKPV
jgi:tryptophan 2-monooxygenase